MGQMQAIGVLTPNRRILEPKSFPKCFVYLDLMRVTLVWGPACLFQNGLAVWRSSYGLGWWTRKESNLQPVD